ncbi:hypothetical protein A0J61_00253 [Choanephora cucurbitarum]|uniref:Uncharacterized protein n=1 Tax=Choanephora cucurbitarum TaxID=101091 RepID=A0A1C7NRV9_9FUNG|nr:hypothetical protein A0J61_00253 [Choanephora cucurbitarum]
MSFNDSIQDTIPGFQIMCLTPEEDDYPYEDQYDDQQDICWLDDCECQENLATILPLIPEACIVDKDNHIQSMDGIHVFFEELGYFTEEPEPIDPTRDYDAEAKQLLEERNKTRKQHIDLSPVPSLDNTDSGMSSTSSSFHAIDEQHPTVHIRSPLSQTHNKSVSTHTTYIPLLHNLA